MLQYDTGLQRVSWHVNGTEQTAARGSNSVDFSSLDPGAYLIEMTVIDDSGSVRNDPAGLTEFTRDWLVRVVAP